VTTCSATLGLEILIVSLNLKPSSRILIPAFTFIATASAIKGCGHIPVVAEGMGKAWNDPINSFHHPLHSSMNHSADAEWL
jgi:dTDP-4-amino-4,6-dideoxygalactose transaminase